MDSNVSNELPNMRKKVLQAMDVFRSKNCLVTLVDVHAMNTIEQFYPSG